MENKFVKATLLGIGFVVAIILGEITLLLFTVLTSEKSAGLQEFSVPIQQTESAVNDNQSLENVPGGWKRKVDEELNISFSYPKDARIIQGDGCYRIEYEEGFVIILSLSGNSDARCGARTGVGVLPENSDKKDNLFVDGRPYEIDGFEAIYNDDSFYVQDFHYMFDIENQFRIGYGLYQRSQKPFHQDHLNQTMSTIRKVVESIKTINKQ